MLADRITILRDGEVVVTDGHANFDRDEIVQRDGRPRPVARALRTAQKPQCGLPASGADRSQKSRMGSDGAATTRFSVFAGQITGVFGLVGSGRTETFKIVAGVSSATSFMAARSCSTASRCATACRAPAVRDGIVYVTEDRKIEGFFETMSIADNIYLGLLAKLRGKRTLVSSA